MRTRRFWSLLLVVCMLLATLAGCGVKGEDDQTTAPAATEPGTTTAEAATTEPVETTAAVTTEQPPLTVDGYVSATDCSLYVKEVGRSRFYRGAFILDWSASGIEFAFSGSGDLRVDIEKEGSSSNAVLIAEVDGEEHTLNVNTAGVQTYRVVTGLAEGEHHVLIRRRNMVEDGSDNGILVGIKGFRMTGSLLKRPADNKYMVAFLGDSILCGHGLPNQNGLATYAMDLCKRESFDYDVCSVSGFGVYCSSTRHGFTENTLTKYYPYFNYYRSTTLRYMPERTADLVIVNLNTNDNNFGWTNSPETPYKEALKTLISEIREIHGENVPIVWIVGMMISPDSGVNQCLNEVFAELGGEAAGLYTITVETNTAGGDGGHPDASSHAAVSQALSAFIRTKSLLDLPAQQ